MSQMRLLGERRFWPLFWTQFLGAFNDNFFKNALVILVTYGAVSSGGLPPEQMVALSAGLFILPFFLFSATAGQLADKYPKSALVPWVKALEVAIMCLAAAGFWLESLPFLLTVLFLMGLQSTFFGPIKYGILPQLLGDDDLVGGNALVEMGTFLAILLGTIGGGLLIAVEGWGTPLVSAGVVGFALLGLGASLFIRPVPREAPDLKIRFNPVTPTWEIFKITREIRSVYLSILAVSWFWFFGASLLALFPIYCKEVLGGNEHLVTFFLALFSVGIAAGSMLTNRLSQGRIELGLVPLGSIGMTVFTADLFLAGSPPLAAVGEAGIGVGAFLSSAAGLRITADLVLLSVCGGFYIVPLHALIQHRAKPAERARVIAGNNILSAFFMVLSSLMLMGLHALELSIPTIFLLIAVLNFIIAVYVYTVIPEFLYRFLGWILANTIYKIHVSGHEHLPADGAAVLVCNHVSYADWLVLGGNVPRPLRFVMHHSFNNIPIVNRIFSQGHVIPIASTKESPTILREAFRRIKEELEDGQLLCIFPEGRLTTDGQLQDFKSGIERIVAETPVPVIPVGLDGMWESVFSRKPGPKVNRLPQRWRAKVSIGFGAPIPPDKVSAAHLREVVAGLRGEEEGVGAQDRNEKPEKAQEMKEGEE